MASHPELPPAHNPEYSGPSIGLEINGIKITSTWQNTTLRTFLKDAGVYDHLECLLGNGKLVGVLLTDFDQPQTLREFLEENNYPRRIDPVVDARTAEWYLEDQARRIEAEWAAGFGVPPETLS